MATIIDSLVVILGLDPSDFKKGQKETGEALKNTEERAEQTAKNLQVQGRKAAEFFSQVRNQVIALATTFTAGAGLKAFVEHMTSADASLGRTARNIGVSTETLSLWQGVAERAGGTAQGIAGSMQGLSQQFQQLYLTGQSQIVPFFRAVGVGLVDASGKMRPMGDILLDLSDKFSKMDPARAQALGRGMGLDEGTINVLMQGRGAITAMLAEQAKLNVASKEDTAAAARRQSAFRALGQASEQLGRVLLTRLTPALESLAGVLTRVAQWFQDNPVAFTAFAATLGAVAVAVTAALTMMSVQGFVALVASMLKVAPAAAQATAGMETAAAAGSGGLLKMLGGLAKSALLLAAAWEVGQAIGGQIWKAIEGTELGDKIGGFVTKVLASLGNKDAQEAMEADLNAKAGLPPRSPSAPSRAKPKTATMTTQASPSGNDAPRGIRNNNPGNLNYVGQQGATKEAGPGGRFAVFPTMEAGIAALGKQLQLYASRGDDSVRRIISKYAPAGENNTDAYIASVAKKLGVGTEQHLNLKDPIVLKGMVQAITDVEVGKGKVQDRQIDSGLVAMGMAPPQVASASDPLHGLLQPGPRADRALLAGAGATAAATNNVSNVSHTSQTSTAETHIDTVNVQLPSTATDADSIAQGIGPAMRRNFSLAAQANFSLA